MKKVFCCIVLLFFAGVAFYLQGIMGLLEFIVTLGIYIAIFYLLNYGWRALKKQAPREFYEFLEVFLYGVSWVLLVLFIIIGGFAYTYNRIIPAKMPEYTLTNGEKTIKFQAMVHVGEEGFYNTIINNLTDFKEEGGVYFFEGVRPGSEESTLEFNEALGMTFTPDLYTNFSKLYGVTFQDTSKFLGLVNDLDFNVDLSMDEIVELYKIKAGDTDKQKTPPIDANFVIEEILASANDRELKLLIYMNKAILNFFIGNDFILEQLTNTYHDKELFEVILDERNKVLVDAVNESEYDKIFITYGLLHFRGFFEMLEESDSRWEIVETNNLYPISK